MRKLLLLLLLILLNSCGTTRYVPVESKVDSVYVEKIVERYDTIFVNIPTESKEIGMITDSSHLETSVAVSDAWIGKDSSLHHRLENKGDVSLKKEIIYKDRIIEKEVIKEIPVIQEVEVPVKYVPEYYKRVSVGFWVLLSILIVIVGWKVMKFVRKF